MIQMGFDFGMTFELQIFPSDVCDFTSVILVSFETLLKRLFVLFCLLHFHFPLNKDTSKRRQFNVFVVRSKDVHRGARMKVFATSFLDVFLEFSINVQMT